MTRTPQALLADVVAVLVFVTIGRRSHAESDGVLGVLDTAWPFLVGLGVAWLVARAWRHPLRLRPEGVTVWVLTVTVGVLLRVVTGQGTAVSFVVVTAVVLGVFLLGWRALLPLVSRRRARR